jgi:hypothetical protein
MAEPSTTELKYHLRRDFALRRRRQRHSLAQLKDCAHIAALQTIDVRIHLLENPEAPSGVQSILWDAAVAACFGFAGGLIVKGLTSVFNDILRTRWAFALFPKSDLGLWTKQQMGREYDRQVGGYKKMLELLYKERFTPEQRATMKDEITPVLKKAQQEFHFFQKGFLDQPDVRLLYHEATFKMVDPLIAKAGDVAAVKQLLLAAVAEKGGTELDQKDLPTASVIRDALAFFNRQSEAQEIVLDELEIAVDSDAYTHADLKALSGMFYAQQLADAESVLLEQDMWIRYFELCIWVSLYPDIGGSEHRIHNIGSSDVGIQNVPTRLSDYLLKRIYSGEKKDSRLGRPLTILEQSMLKTDPQRVFLTATGKKSKSQEILLPNGVKEQALIILIERCRSCAIGMRGAIDRLYSKSVR